MHRILPRKTECPGVVARMANFVEIEHTLLDLDKVTHVTYDKNFLLTFVYIGSGATFQAIQLDGDQRPFFRKLLIKEKVSLGVTGL